MAETFPTMGQGPAKIADSDSLKKDDHGFTNPDLHRRIDPKSPEDELEVKPREYSIGIYGHDSYRTTTIHIHDEKDDDRKLEVP